MKKLLLFLSTVSIFGQIYAQPNIEPIPYLEIDLRNFDNTDRGLPLDGDMAQRLIKTISKSLTLDPITGIIEDQNSDSSVFSYSGTRGTLPNMNSFDTSITYPYGEEDVISKSVKRYNDQGQLTNEDNYNAIGDLVNNRVLTYEDDGVTLTDDISYRLGEYYQGKYYYSTGLLQYDSQYLSFVPSSDLDYMFRVSSFNEDGLKIYDRHRQYVPTLAPSADYNYDISNHFEYNDDDKLEYVRRDNKNLGFGGICSQIQYHINTGIDSRYFFYDSVRIISYVDDDFDTEIDNVLNIYNHVIGTGGLPTETLITEGGDAINKFEFEYDVNGYRTIYNKYNFVSGIYKLVSETISSYDDEGRMLSEQISNNNLSGDTLDFYTLSEMSYNSAGYLTYSKNSMGSSLIGYPLEGWYLNNELKYFRNEFNNIDSSRFVEYAFVEDPDVASTFHNNPIIMRDIDYYYTNYTIPSSIEDLEELNPFVIYPNPASGLLYIQNPDNISLTFTITNITGQRVIDINGFDKQSLQRVDVSALGSGIYILIIQSEDGRSYFSKFVKQ